MSSSEMNLSRRICFPLCADSAPFGDFCRGRFFVSVCLCGQALKAAVHNAKCFIFETLPVNSLAHSASSLLPISGVRVTVLAAEDGDSRICIDPQVWSLISV